MALGRAGGACTSPPGPALLEASGVCRASSGTLRGGRDHRRWARSREQPSETTVSSGLRGGDRPLRIGTRAGGRAHGHRQGERVHHHGTGRRFRPPRGRELCLRVRYLLPRDALAVGPTGCGGSGLLETGRESARHRLALRVATCCAAVIRALVTEAALARGDPRSLGSRTADHQLESDGIPLESGFVDVQAWRAGQIGATIYYGNESAPARRKRLK